MDKYDRHLQFLMAAFPDKGEETCKEVFLSTAKRDVRKALFFLTQPALDAATLLEAMATATTVEKQIAQAEQWLHCYCPNKMYTKVVKQLGKGKPMKIDTATLPKLKLFRRPPPKAVLQQLLLKMQGLPNPVWSVVLKGLRPFGRELEAFWATIDFYANAEDEGVIRAALDLLAEMPTGIHKSIMTLTNYLRNPKMRFYALSAMQNTKGLSASLLLDLLFPIVQEYRQLSIPDGPMNDLWQEFRLARMIAENNGVRWSIPDIRLERF